MQQESWNLGKYAAVERMHVKHMPHRHRLLELKLLHTMCMYMWESISI